MGKVRGMFDSEPVPDVFKPNNIAVRSIFDKYYQVLYVKDARVRIRYVMIDDEIGDKHIVRDDGITIRKAKQLLDNNTFQILSEEK